MQAANTDGSNKCRKATDRAVCCNVICSWRVSVNPNSEEGPSSLFSEVCAVVALLGVLGVALLVVLLVVLLGVLVVLMVPNTLLKASTGMSQMSSLFPALAMCKASMGMPPMPPMPLC